MPRPWLLPSPDGAYTMMSWLNEGPMELHVAVELWSGSGTPVKCLQTLSLQFSKSVDGYKLILSAWSPEASSARSQGEPKMAVRIAGVWHAVSNKNDVILPESRAQTYARPLAERCGARSRISGVYGWSNQLVN